MAKIPYGILGNFVGTAGNVNGYVRNGQNYLRSRRRKSTRPMTPNRLAQQEKFKVCAAFTKPFSGKGFFQKTFPAYGHSGSAFNRATSAIMHLAITGDYPNFTVSYPLVLVSKGLLPGAESANVAIQPNGQLVFNWTSNSGTGTAKDDDKVVLLAYFPELQQILFSFGAGTRSNGTAILDATLYKGHAAETWISFLTADESNASDSVHCGSVVV